jgi:hypothetical protein
MVVGLQVEGFAALFTLDLGESPTKGGTMQDQSDSQKPQTNDMPILQLAKKSPPLIYSHPEVDPIIDRLFPELGDNQSIRHVLDAIIWKQRLKRIQSDRDKEKGQNSTAGDFYSWFNHEFYLRLLGPTEYVRRMGLLVENGILNRSDFTSPRGRHPIFQVANPKWMSGYALKPVTVPRVLKKIFNYHRWRLSHCAPLDNRMREHIIEHFRYIGLSKDDFFALWEKRYYSRYITTKPEPLSLKKYMGCGENCWLVIDRWNQSSDMDKENPDWIHSCTFGNRLHHPFTYLPSDIRPYILDKQGNPYRFTEYDLANSQPALFANLLVGRDNSFRNTRFVQLIESCLIYEDLGRQQGLNRQLAKTEFLHYLYCRTTSHAQQQFERIYDRPAIEARRLKSQEYDEDGSYIPFNKRHTLLPRQMQRMESTIFREVWRELLAKGFVFLPIHDAVYVANLNRAAKKEILVLMKMKLRQYMKIKFRIKVKRIQQQIQ